MRYRFTNAERAFLMRRQALQIEVQLDASRKQIELLQSKQRILKNQLNQLEMEIHTLEAQPTNYGDIHETTV